MVIGDKRYQFYESRIDRGIGFAQGVGFGHIFRTFAGLTV